MITEIGLTNFKCFKGEHNFPLSRFNLLTGINGKGKSTLLQSLLLMKQTVDYDTKCNYIIFNGTCVELGEYNDIRNSFASNDEGIQLSFRFSADKKKYTDNPSLIFRNINLHYVFIENTQDKYMAIIDSYSVFDLEEDGTLDTEEVRNLENDDYTLIRYNGQDYSLDNADDIKAADMFINLIPKKGYRADTTINAIQGIFKHIQFISADRIGPKNYYKIENINKDFSWVGAKGENTASILLKKKDIEVHKALYLGEDTNTLLQQTEEWLNFIFDGAKINVNTEGTVISITYNTKQGGERYKPSNVGFGYSYILPIVVAGLIAQDGEILIIENPEAHLHPRAQHKLTQFSAKVAATGVQIFVESHSEHILNALRICTIEQNGQEKILNNTDLSILYFQDNSTTPCVQIPIDEKGGIEEWPEGFFDQTDKDFKILFGF